MIPLPCACSSIPVRKFSLPQRTDIWALFSDPGGPIRKFRARRVSPSRNGNSVKCSLNPMDPQERRAKTLFPGGFKRPEIKVPSLILKLSSKDVLDGEGCLNVVDLAVSKWVGIVLLESGEESGGRLYEAARALKSVIGDRAYLVISERVDIAAAVGSSGIVLSDEGLPTIVARNMLRDSKPDSIILPLVARIVRTADTAFNASNSEGADFLIVASGGDESARLLVKSICQSVKVPVFVMFDLVSEATFLTDALKLLPSDASGLVISMKSADLLGDDILNQFFSFAHEVNKRNNFRLETSSNLGVFEVEKRSYGRKGSVHSVYEQKAKTFIESERLVLLEGIAIMRKAAPMMEEISLLEDAVSRLDDPFLLVIVGEFNSGKSTVINALLGEKYLKDGVIPTTNEITLLCYSKMDNNQPERCERHPDGQFICYLPAPILKEMNIVDTPGTNVILQRQQKLTEEFVPRADLILFVISADRPFTESEVAFLRYIQQWKKKVVFVLNKSDIYLNRSELEEATIFIKENAQKLLSAEHVTLYPVSARSALEAKLKVSSAGGQSSEDPLLEEPRWTASGFSELENFLFSFLDGSTNTVERIKLKLETPIGIADRLLTASETLVRNECKLADLDLLSVKQIVGSVKDCAQKMEMETSFWRRQILSLVQAAKGRAVELTESTLQLSNLDLVANYFFQGEKSVAFSPTSRMQNEIIDPALSDAHRMLQEYLAWLESSYAREVTNYQESFLRTWPSSVNSQKVIHSESYEFPRERKELTLQVLENFRAEAAGKLFEQEIREVVLGTFGGLGAAGLSASLLTSVLPTTLEDLLALGLCSAGGLLAVSNFPARRRAVTDKVKRVADSLAQELEDAMCKDFSQTIEDLQRLIEFIAQPYQEAAQERLYYYMNIQEELSNVDKKLNALKIELQNFHVS